MTAKPPSSPAVTRAIHEFELRSGLTVPAWLTSQTAAGIGYSVAQQAYGKTRQWINQKRNWTITISGDDELFFDAQLWLMTQTSQDTTRKALRAHTRWTANPFGPNKNELLFLADDDEVQDIFVDGHKVEVFVDDNEGNARAAGSQRENMQMLKPPKLVFRCKTRVARDAVTQKLAEIKTERSSEKRTPGLMVLDKWGDWNRRADLPPRPMESVIVKGAVLGDFFADLKDFVAREPDYVRRAIPYHRAYLLIGPPGTGKTSAVKAVANALEMDLWYAQLSGIDKDAKLSDVFAAVRNRGVLLLEDIDSLPAAIDRTGDDAPDGDISTSGLLNALDGVATPHGLITVMTTNHPEHLDPALLRPGRIDRVFEFEHPDRPTMIRHFEFFYGEKPKHAAEWQTGRSSAALSEVFKRHMDSAEAADYALCDEMTEGEEREWHTPASFPGAKRGSDDITAIFN